mgnify:CR=1 FL=1
MELEENVIVSENEQKEVSSCMQAVKKLVDSHQTKVAGDDVNPESHKPTH